MNNLILFEENDLYRKNDVFFSMVVMKNEECVFFGGEDWVLYCFCNVRKKVIGGCDTGCMICE